MAKPWQVSLLALLAVAAGKRGISTIRWGDANEFKCMDVATCLKFQQSQNRGRERCCYSCEDIVSRLKGSFSHMASRQAGMNTSYDVQKEWQTPFLPAMLAALARANVPTLLSIGDSTRLTASHLSIEMQRWGYRRRGVSTSLKLRRKVSMSPWAHNPKSHPSSKINCVSYTHEFAATDPDGNSSAKFSVAALPTGPHVLSVHSPLAVVCDAFLTSWTATSNLLNELAPESLNQIVVLTHFGLHYQTPTQLVSHLKAMNTWFRQGSNSSSSAAALTSMSSWSAGSSSGARLHGSRFVVYESVPQHFLGGRGTGEYIQALHEQRYNCTGPDAIGASAHNPCISPHSSSCPAVGAEPDAHDAAATFDLSHILAEIRALAPNKSLLLSADKEPNVTLRRFAANQFNLQEQEHGLRMDRAVTQIAANAVRTMCSPWAPMCHATCATSVASSGDWRLQALRNELQDTSRDPPVVHLSEWASQFGFAKKGFGRKRFEIQSPFYGLREPTQAYCYHDCTHFCFTNTLADALLVLPVWRQLHVAVLHCFEKLPIAPIFGATYATQNGSSIPQQQQGI